MFVEDMTALKYREVLHAMGLNSGDSHKIIMQRVNACIDLMPTPVDVQSITSPDGLSTWDGNRWVYNKDLLIDKVFDNPYIVDWLFRGQKISAIKELRNITKCGLKEAKDAVESKRVQDAIHFRKKEDVGLAALREKLTGTPGDVGDEQYDEGPYAANSLQPESNGITPDDPWWSGNG